MKIIVTIICISLLLWGATAYWGQNQIYQRFDHFIDKQEVEYKRIENIKNTDMIEIEDQQYNANWAYRNGYAIFPCVIYFEYTVFSKDFGLVSNKTLDLWFFGQFFTIWSKEL